MTPQKQRILVKGEDKTDSINSWRQNGDKIDVTFSNGKTYSYNASNVSVVESALNAERPRDCFDYLKRVAENVGLVVTLDDGKQLNTLAHSYSKIDFVAPDSMLGAFLNGKPSENGEQRSAPIASTEPDIIIPLFPFGFNISQKQAVENALSSPLSIIEGPPGTGKTQTILNIIANAVMRGESVAVVSSNNSATANVLEKLQKYGVDFIAAYLGNSGNKREFIGSQVPLPDTTEWKLIERRSVAAQRQRYALFSVLREKLARKNDLSALKQELSSVETEQKHFLEYCKQIVTLPEPNAARKVEKSEQALEMWLLCETYVESHDKGIIAFIKSILELLGLIGKSKSEIQALLQTYPREYLVAVFQRRFYELKISDLTRQASALMLELEAFDFDSKMNEYSELSAELFRNYLADKYAGHKRKRYEIDDLWKNSEEFIADYPVILSTTYSLRSSLSPKVMYDYVIIDESSQVNLATGALALSCARKAVVVGDLKQLPNVVDRKTAELTDEIFAEYDLPEVYRYKNHSLLSAVAELFPAAPRVLLREHYRCHPLIIEFCNQKFYNGELIILTEPKSARQPLVVYQTAEGNHARDRINRRQIDVIRDEVIPQQNLDIERGSVGIVTPYRNQTNALQEAFVGTAVKADTVDKFQGRENDIIVLSTVDNEVSEFSDDANRLNVAISRAIEQLIVVVSAADTERDTNIGDLVRYIRYNNVDVIQSGIYSVFDYLYKSYAEKRAELFSKLKNKLEYDSETLMFALIKNILKGENFSQFGVSPHVPLKMIIRNRSKLSSEEMRYAMNDWTHVDFLIFDKIGKAPRLVIEVDGASYHKAGTRQAERDELKNGILEKYGLSYIRFRTDESGERQRLIDALSR